MIKARNIIKSYQNGESRFQVLKDISLDIVIMILWLFSAHLVLASQPF